jgi:hypothetical protein
VYLGPTLIQDVILSRDTALSHIIATLHTHTTFDIYSEHFFKPNYK